MLQNLDRGFKVAGVKDGQREIYKAKVPRAISEIFTACFASGILGGNALSHELSGPDAHQTLIETAAFGS